MDPEQLGHLVEHDDQADTGLEAGQDGCRDEVGDEAQAQDTRQHQHDAHQGGQGRGGGH